VNSNQTATYCSLNHQSERATSVGVIVSPKVIGDIAILDRDWTGVVAREHIVVEKQLICETEKKQENIHESTTRKKDNGTLRLTNSPNLTRLLISDGIVPVKELLKRPRPPAQTVQTNH
jgi:hypothetical protein